MNTISVRRALNDYSKFEETECALDISPCPRLDAANTAEENTRFVRADFTPLSRPTVEAWRQTDFDDNKLTETLSISWVIALAIAVALVVGVSGG